MLFNMLTTKHSFIAEKLEMVFFLLHSSPRHNKLPVSEIIIQHIVTLLKYMYGQGSMSTVFVDHSQQISCHKVILCVREKLIFL